MTHNINYRHSFSYNRNLITKDIISNNNMNTYSYYMNNNNGQFKIIIIS